MMRPMTLLSRRAVSFPGVNMSWSISKTLEHTRTSVGLQKNLDELNAVDRGNVGNQACEKERDEQIDAAIKAAFQVMVEAGFVNAEEIQVSLSGHANKDHQEDPFMSNEFINIAVAVRSHATIER
jgi:hypothetical protein